jgi:hypothetical protein
MSQRDADSDWLDPEPDTDLRPLASKPFAGVWRIEAHGEEGMPFDTLLSATTEPPMDPEAEVRGQGGCLAQSHPDRAGWIYTALGAARIRAEVTNTLSGAA